MNHVLCKTTSSCFHYPIAHVSTINLTICNHVSSSETVPPTQYIILDLLFAPPCTVSCSGSGRHRTCSPCGFGIFAFMLRRARLIFLRLHACILYVFLLAADNNRLSPINVNVMQLCFFVAQLCQFNVFI